MTTLSLGPNYSGSGGSFQPPKLKWWQKIAKAIAGKVTGPKVPKR